MPTDAKKKSPFGLSEWLDFLKSKKFPVKDTNLARLKSHYSKENSSLANMHEELSSDPLLAFAIINQANKFKKNDNSEIGNPVHAAAMLGSNSMQKMLSRFSPVDIHSNKPNLKAFLREVEISFESATLAKNWTLKKLPGHEESIFWVTLFKDAVRWLLWFYAYPLMRAVSMRITKGEKSGQAELNILGCRIDELTIRLFTHWKTSSRLIDPFLAKNLPSTKDTQALAKLAHITNELPDFTEDKKLIILINSPLIYSTFASKVVREAHKRGWDSKQLFFFYRVMAAITRKYISEVIESTHTSCIETAKRYDFGGHFLLAKQLLEPNLYKGTAPKKPASLTPVAKLKKALGKNNNYDTKYKASLALKTIKQAIPHANHCIIFKHTKDRIAPLLQSGYDTVEMKKIRWNTPPSSVFKKLLSKQSAIHLFGEKLTSISKKLPEKSDALLGKNSHLILSSVQISATDMAIFWLETQEKFDENDFKTLKQIVSLTAQNKS
ncbi:HDOD domain-containing protein [Marinomonas sp. C2222]|uniref:HDOD domain-containing protein n=1 Tax=Marinomonas sargassi TaxID=2984494 RepID=A0ABT2YU26_9GAMM|nr:HDOD domain-containing protein [Marinomonas sargassi]MCV2403109.1 HDOD domain-containing protein [Marinomonas sargassi]